jgi:hypothetical protein
VNFRAVTGIPGSRGEGSRGIGDYNQMKKDLDIDWDVIYDKFCSKFEAADMKVDPNAKTFEIFNFFGFKFFYF